MATGDTLTGLVRHLRRRCGESPTDGDLLADFVVRRDEAAFAELVRSRTVGGHGRRAPAFLPHCQAAEDVVEATFAALARKRIAARPAGIAGQLAGHGGSPKRAENPGCALPVNPPCSPPPAAAVGLRPTDSTK